MQTPRATSTGAGEGGSGGPERGYRRSVVGHASLLTSSHTLGQALFLIRGLALARLLGPQTFGVWASMRLVRDLGRYVSLGAVEGMEQLAPLAEARGERERARRLRSVAAGVVTAVALATAPVIAGLGWHLSDSSGDLSIAWFLFAGVFLLAQLYFFALAFLRSHHRFGLIGVTTLAVTACSMLGLLLVPRFGLSGFLTLLAMAYAGGILLAGLGRPLVRPRVERATTGELLAAGHSVLIANLLASLQWNVDKFLLWALAGSSALGLYTVPTYLVNAVILFPRNVAAVLYPRLRETIGREGTLASALPFLEKATVLTGQLACPVLGLLTVSLELLVLGLLPGYRPAIAPGRVLLLATFFPIVAALPATVLVSLRAERQLTAIRALGLALSATAVGAVLARGGDLLQVALASSAGLILQSACTLAAARRRLELAPARSLRLLASLGGPFALLIGIVLAAGGLEVATSWQELLVTRGPLTLLAAGIFAAWAVRSGHRLGHLARRRDG